MTKPVPEARALSESALLDLADALNEAETPEVFLASADAIIAKADNLLPLPVSLGVPDTLNVEGKRAKDVDNAPRVHEYLGEIDRANASDARLWSYLAFGTYRDYMERRWSLFEVENWKGRVKDRWLLPNGFVTRGRLVRHGVARLWWVSHLTFMPAAEEGIAKDDPYAYTKEVFKSEDRLNAIFDREVGAFPSVMKAVLDHAASIGTQASDKYLQRVMQYLTLINGYRDVGMLDVSALCDLIDLAALRASSAGDS